LILCKNQILPTAVLFPGLLFGHHVQYFSFKGFAGLAADVNDLGQFFGCNHWLLVHQKKHIEGFQDGELETVEKGKGSSRLNVIATGTPTGVGNFPGAIGGVGAFFTTKLIFPLSFSQVFQAGIVVRKYLLKLIESEYLLHNAGFGNVFYIVFQRFIMLGKQGVHPGNFLRL
jgi:hypothetical protein